MTIDDVIRRIREIGIIPVVRAATVEEATRAVEAIRSGGIPIAEITMTVPNAVSVIRSLTERYAADVLIGAGTVSTAEEAESCIRAGAEFLVSPGLSVPVLSVSDGIDECPYPGRKAGKNFPLRKRGRPQILAVSARTIP